MCGKHRSAAVEIEIAASVGATGVPVIPPGMDRITASSPVKALAGRRALQLDSQDSRRDARVPLFAGLGPLRKVASFSRTTGSLVARQSSWR